jgi:hypothetical protein
MNDTEAVAKAANKLNKEKTDDAALEVLVGLRARAIEKDALLGDDLELAPRYDDNTMGASLDSVKALGRRVVLRWNRELCEIVCGGKGENEESRTKILTSLKLDEAAVIAAVATSLLSLGVAAALAAATAPLIVRKFVWPAKDELCAAWKESLDAIQ